jgi:4-amino-4-deoxy-L-arabinose transferase-like glycosyltransferase
MSKHITDYCLYRWRYLIGYGLIGLILFSVFIVAGLYIPGGLSQTEMQAVVTSDALSLSLTSFDPASIVNLPYHLLQRISIELFGLSHFSIKLPSLLLGLASAIGMLLLLRMWFRQNVAVLTTVLVITTGQFLFVAQSGSAGIIYIFWSIWLLVAAMMVSRRKGVTIAWKIALFAIAALSLYTPLSIYILLALISAVALHPHLRFLVRRLSKPRLLIAACFALVLVTPLLYAVWREPSVGTTLLGVPTTWPDFQANAVQLLKQYLDFVSPNSGMLMTPIYGLGSMILIAIGVVRLVTTKYTARSYITAAWIILLLPVLVINPNFVSITFVPVVLLMAMGISRLLNSWYRLFPLNPYARLAGLIPLVVLIGGLVLSGVDRYMYGYLYNPETATNFSKDLRLVNAQLAMPERGKTALVVSQSELPFYTVVAHHRDNVTVATAPTPDTTTTIVTKAAYITNKQRPPYRIITDSRAGNSDRFYIYKTDKK